MKLHHSDQVKKSKVQYLHISADDEGQRIDNFLLSYLKTVPKSRVYRLLRKGEVRINRKRIKAAYRLTQGDVLRLPPLFLTEQSKAAPPAKQTLGHLAQRILYEDAHILILNKPSGMSVHAGSTVRIGIIEALRHLYPQFPQLELAHRLDSETSGCLIFAKRKKILRELHALLREGKIKKTYLALTKGIWLPEELKIDLPLKKEYHDGGKHVVKVHQTGKSALTIFNTINCFNRPKASLMEINLLTGRTHQIRVHAAYKNHPIALDDRYGDNTFNKVMHELGLKRLFLHARSVAFTLADGKHIEVVAPLDDELTETIERLSNEHERAE